MKHSSFFYSFLLIAGIVLNTSCTDKEKDCCKKHDSSVKKTTFPAPDKKGESIYQIEGKWVNQKNIPVKLTECEGKVQIVAMVFTHCGSACPRIVADMQLIESKLTPAQKDKVEFLLVSFDTERDSPEQLAAFAKEKELSKNWTLLHGDENSVRELALVLGVKYDQQLDGSFAHSNIITTLDTNGSIVFQQEGLGAAPDKTLATITEILN